MKILIIQQKMIGDVLTSSILFEILRKEYPKAELHYLINSHTYPVAQNNPNIDKFIFLTPEIEKNKIHFFKFLFKLRKEHYDTVVDVYSKLSSNLITVFSGAKTKISKYKWYTSFIYNKNYKEKIHPKTNAGLAIENRLQLLDEVVKSNNIKPIQPKVYLDASEIKSAKELLQGCKIDLSKPLYMISVLGSNITKTYPLAYMAKIIDAIVSTTKGNILFNYIPSQIEDVNTLYNLCDKKTRSYIHLDIYGKTLREFIAITKHCTALIGNEGGAVNMAKAINVPTYAIYSPWIKKEAWSMFEDGKNNVSIHLKDVRPELYKDINSKEAKAKWTDLYNEFSPEFIIDDIIKFIKQ